jgi:hypothetical protein
MHDRSKFLPRIRLRLKQIIPGVLCVLVLKLASAACAQGYERQVVTEWDFTKAIDSLGWLPHGRHGSFGVQNGALVFTATPQATSVYSPEIAVRGRSMQLVEIVMSSRVEGPVGIFWSPLPGSPISFLSGNEDDIKMPGDGAVHRYFLPVHTEPGTTICQLMLSFPVGAAVAIQRISIVALVASPSSSGSPIWKFTENGNLLGWTPYSGVVDLSVSGGYLHLKAISNATILAPNAQITNQLEWFSLFARVTQTTLQSPWVQFNFLGNQNGGNPTTVYLPLAVDAASHVYNENVGGANGWWAGVSQVSVSVSESTELEISEMELSTTPQGPADLVVDSFGPATPFLRAGKQFKVSCQVWDRGAAAAEQLAVKLHLPTNGSLSVVSLPTVPTSVAGGYPQTLVWTLLANKSGSFPISVTAEAHSLSAQASTILLVNPEVTANNSGYVPAPTPAASEYNIGAYYFPGWSLDSHWDPIREFPERMPALGYYAEGNPQVLDWQIKWAVEHGISFFAVDWFWFNSGGSGPAGELPSNFLEAYSAASYRDYVKFCIAYANGNGATAGSVAEFESIAKAWIKEYFSQPGYLKIDGKPVVFTIAPGLLDTNLGVQTKQALDDARQLAKNAGLGGIYFVADTAPSQVSEFIGDGYDALSAYNYPGVGTNNPDESPFSDLVSAYPGVWDSILDSSSIPYLIPTMRGWDPRPWAYYNAPEDQIRTGSTPQLFETMLEQAKDRMDAGRAPKVLLVEAWNELGEGSAIEPTAGDGFGYLDAIRNVFVGNSPHTDLVPSDVALPTLEVQPATSLWTFTSGADLAPWQVALGPPYWNWTTDVTESKVTNNQWTFNGNGYADLLRMGFELSAERYSSVAITMSTSIPAYVTAYWGADDEPGPSAVRNASFSATPGPMQRYTIPLAGLTGWRGNINLLRLTFSTSSTSKVAIQSIQFLPATGESSFAVSRNEIDFRVAAGGSAPASQALSIAGGVGGKLNWTATAANANWLSLSQPKGAAPGNLALSVHPSGLAVGVYRTVLTVSATGAGGGTASVPVTLWVMPKAVKPAVVRGDGEDE